MAWGIDIHALDFDKMQGLISVCVQDQDSLAVLMVGFMNRDALAQTLATGHVTFWSRTKNRLWTKGESSGHRLKVTSIFVDCDEDTLLIKAQPMGPTCHTGNVSCFGELSLPKPSVFHELEATIAQRAHASSDGSYTASLLQDGIKRIAQKVGEEGLEVALAAVIEDDQALLGELADLSFHALVLMHARQLRLQDLSECLHQRRR
jgi:phosphoribosyl-ATP pyrophosphohydrolase/phosphoribosyl-AMP cyclohydrolase